MPTRVLVAEDSRTVRKYLVAVLREDPEIEVIGEAEDGKQAIELCEQLRPDVVSLDMMLPVMSGLAATEYIMAYCATPILIVSASFNRGEMLKTYDALSAGAVDVLEKPQPGDTGRWENDYRRAIKMVARIPVMTHHRASIASRARSPEQPPYGGPGRFRCVAIGASTGGPGAVLKILKALPPSFPLPILLVIHIGVPFGSALSEWLDSASPIRVRVPTSGEPLAQIGQTGVVIAPPDRHLVLRSGRLWLTEEPARHHCRPSVDVLLESVAQELGSSAIACLLTGMGRDGAQGLLDVRRGGGMTIAQDQQSSVVFGIPRAAIELNAAHSVLSLADIAPALTRLAMGERSGIERGSQ